MVNKDEYNYNPVFVLVLCSRGNSNVKFTDKNFSVSGGIEDGFWSL